MFRRVRATGSERAGPRPGDALIAPADIVMDRAFTLDATPETVWPWLAQLGKRRAGWYLPRRIEWLIPRSRRATRAIDGRWQRLSVGDVIPDYGGRDETFTVAEIDPPTSVVYRSQRGRTDLTWSISLEPAIGRVGATRVFLRLRMAPIKHQWLARTGGELIDVLTVAGMAAGLRERIADGASGRR